MRIIFFLLLILLISPGAMRSQGITQNLRGTVVDKESRIPLPGATVVISGTDPLIGTTSDENGNFRLIGVKVGRYDIQVSFVGYQGFTAREIMVISGKETVLDIELSESVESLRQVEIMASSNKGEPLNSMAIVSARQVNMEEANRYAGGFDDPARLVSSFAGVTYNVGNNAIVIRGNSPKGLLWRMEGIQIPNPNHFADYITLGGGAVTALSSQTMASSDFFTGAFPSEYGNGLSGVFDIKMRTGNTGEREYTIQAGLVGIDIAAEGPFKKGGNASYLFNYRYSTLGLLAPILPEEMGILTYQDLSFKLNFPTKAGIFSVWGIGAFDYQGKGAENDSTKWENSDDSKDFSAKLTMGATGISYKKILGSRTYFQATVGATQNGIKFSQSRYDSLMIMSPKNKVEDYRWNYTFSTYANHKFGPRHTNRTGIIYNWLWYDTQIQNADEYGDPLVTYSNGQGNAGLMQLYSQSRISIMDDLILNAGFHAQYFFLSNKYSIEPRMGISWNFKSRHTLTLAYGLHSQIEKIQLYLVEQETPGGTIMPNKSLDLNKAHHFVLGYSFMINENLILRIEPYYQLLYDIPVVPGTYVSTININEVWDFNDSLVNEGNGRNFGIDLTLEKYLNKGYYYLFTASVFDSKYTGGDRIERNTRYNKRYVLNVLGGKEWNVGKDKGNLLSANLRFTFMGGDYIIPVDEDATHAQDMIVEDYTRAYEEKLGDAPILSVGASYRINKPRHSSLWSFQLINALGYKEFQEYEYDAADQSIEKKYDMLIIPNISYKIQF